ncbi:MAG: Gfo/Idh/MocA family oxidoreductase [Anaerolineaceae bacterium]|nr:Gfo/Idh/MocA family oxidoreductase [Anaerolineaceae bacterium]
MINVAVIGAGGWGKNLIRNFAGLSACRLKVICDLDADKLARNEGLYPGVETTRDMAAPMAGDGIDAVVIATPAPTHFALARQALEAGKHVYVEKPMTLAVAEAEELVRLAEARGRKLMVGHLLEYHPCVRKLKALIDDGRLGDLYYMYCQRLNLGVVRKEENAWWSLAPHDVSVVLYLFGAEAKVVTSMGQAYLRKGVEDVVFTQIKFGDGRMASIHVSWLDPHKIRKMTLVGTKKMATFDDMEPNEKIRVYDKSADVSSGSVGYADAISLRQGDIHIPLVKGGEPLRDECRHFLDSIAGDTTPLSDGRDGLRVVKVLEAASRSLAAGGAPIEL